MMNQESCIKTSNNKYFNCPALMSDGRLFTDYRPSAYVNDLIRTQNKVYDSYQYRQFMIHNATKLMDVTDKYNYMKSGCPSCKYDNIPNEASCVYNKKFGLCQPNGNDGLGQNNYASPYEDAEPYNVKLNRGMPQPMRPTGRMFK
jgi:hypothetical protein